MVQGFGHVRDSELLGSISATPSPGAMRTRGGHLCGMDEFLTYGNNPVAQDHAEQRCLRAASAAGGNGRIGGDNEDTLVLPHGRVERQARAPAPARPSTPRCGLPYPRR